MVVGMSLHSVFLWNNMLNTFHWRCLSVGFSDHCACPLQSCHHIPEHRDHAKSQERNQALPFSVGLSNARQQYVHLSCLMPLHDQRKIHPRAPTKNIWHPSFLEYGACIYIYIYNMCVCVYIDQSITSMIARMANQSFSWAVNQLTNEPMKKLINQESSDQHTFNYNTNLTVKTYSYHILTKQYYLHTLCCVLPNKITLLLTANRFIPIL